MTATPQAAYNITKAVFPVAGLGTRFLPATKAQPKEMLCVVDKPLIQYAVEEAYAAGIRHMIFVTGRNKRAIEDHFDTAYELETELERSGKLHLLEAVRAVQPADMLCSYVRQPRSLGLGHAVLCAEQLVGDDAFAVLLADDLMVGMPPVLAQMVSVFRQLQASVLAVQEVPPEDTHKYGIVVGEPFLSVAHGGTGAPIGLEPSQAERTSRVTRLVEKPPSGQAPSRLAVAGRYLLTPAVFAHLRKQTCGAGGEIQLTDGIAALLQDESVYAFAYNGQRYDCGSKEGFVEATVEMALQDREIGSSFAAYLARWPAKQAR